MTGKQNAPEIRFEGFADPWEQRKLGELCTISKGHGYSKADIRDAGTPLILYGRLYTQYESRIENVDTFAVEQEESLLSKGNEVIVPASGETAEDIAVASSVRRSGIIFGGDLNVVTPVSKLDPDYIALAITYSKAHDDLAKRAQGKSVVHVHGNDIAEVEIPYPSESEQKRISTVVLGLDSLITLHQRKYDKLCTVKKSMLDKMFPKPGETEPEIRFEGFTDPWEQRKLGNCGTTYGGLTGKTKEDFGHGNARFIPYTNVFDNPLTDTKRLGAVEIDSSQNQVAYGDAFFTVSSETPDEVGMSSVWLSDQEDVYLNSFCFGYRQDSTFDPHYLAYMLRSRSVRSNLTLLAQGISRFNISKNKVMELSVPVPSAVEQEQLGQYFTKLDSLITLHQRKLELLRNIKKSLLDRMFV